MDGNRSTDEEKSTTSFPNELWDVVLRNLTSPIDQFHASQVCSLWNALLHYKKGTFLFPQVLPTLLNFMEGKDLLKCRYVCKTWKESVDFLLQHGPYYRLTSYLPTHQQLVPLAQVPRDHRIFSETTLTFSQADQIIRFMETMAAVYGQQCKNPIPGRSVRFSPVTNRVHVTDLINYEEQVRTFLARYGSHIWRFQYKLPIHESPNQGKNMLIRLLHSLSNVRTLHFEEGLHWLNRRIMMGEGYHDWTIIRDEEPLPFPELQNLVEINVPSGSMFHGEHMKQVVHAYDTRVKWVHWLAESTVCFKVIFDIEASLREQWKTQARAIVNVEEDDDEKEELEESAVVEEIP